ncbi:ABC transporter substrate-binding protein [Nesterenkonia sp. K-15-9-6]|uniref:ABC transporter substrate-binding protein n=1 Tax=Nesterenkonia sp. K-15-9-6 TaxID=3093918 RepID=UPI004045065E
MPRTPDSRPQDPMIRSLVRSQLAGRRVSRRRLMMGAGAAGLLGALSACGTGGTPGAEEGPAEDLSEESMALFWANWSLYLDYDSDTGSYPTLERFQEETGISVTYAEDIDGNESYYGTVQNQLRQGQGFGQDIITFTDWMAARLIAADQVRELNHENIPHLDNLLPGLRDVGFDPDRRHSVTWQSGMTGLAWNREAVPDGVHSVTQLLTDPDLRGRVVVLDEWRDTLALIMLDQGADVTSFDGDDFEAALEMLEEGISSGQIRQVRGNAYMEDLVSGDALAVMAWSGDITQLNLEEGDRWEFGLPEAGGALWSDNLLIPQGAEHQSNAERLMDFYLQPEVAAEVAAYVNYVCPVQGAQEAMEEIDPELAEDPMIFPTEEMQADLHTIRSMDAEEEAEFTDRFQAVIGN